MDEEPTNQPTRRQLAYNDAARRWLRGTRHRLGITQKAMAARAGIDQSTLSRAESGAGVPQSLDEMIDAVAAIGDKTPEQARAEIIRLMFPEADLAEDAKQLADAAQKPSKRRQAN